MHLNRSRDTWISLVILRNIWQSTAFPYIKEARQSRKTLEKKFIFQIGTLNAHEFIFIVFDVTRYQAIASSIFLHTNHTQPTIPLFAPTNGEIKARNVSFRISLRKMANSHQPSWWNQLYFPPTQYHSFFRSLPLLKFSKFVVFANNLTRLKMVSCWRSTSCRSRAHLGHAFISTLSLLTGSQ